MKKLNSIALLLAMVIGTNGWCGSWKPWDKEGRTISLNGTWQIIFDDVNEGREADWMRTSVFDDHEGKCAIQVPSCWEEMNKDYEGVAFYSRKFKVPSAWKAKTVRLQFDAVNYLSEVYLNDNVLGYHEGGFTPFEFNIEHLLDFDKQNTLTLRVVGPITMSDKVIDGMGKMETPQWRGAYTGGIWQSVTLSATDHVLFDDIFIQPNIHSNKATVAYRINNTGREKEIVTLDAVVRSAKDHQIVATFRQDIALSPGIHVRDVVLNMDHPTYWSPKNPYLYTLESRVVVGDKISEQKNIRFGMREFTIDGRNLLLNGEQMYLKACFFEALYPVKLTNPDSREMMVREIRLAKEAGFNMIRPWRKPPSEAWLELADEMGVLVVGGLVAECMGKPEETPYLPRRIENELRETIVRDRNRASVVMWELFNELHRPVLMNMLHSMSMVARELDPTRLILDESGGWTHGANLYKPFKFEPTPFNDIHSYPGPNISRYAFDKFQVIGLTQKEKMAAGYPKSMNSPGRNVKSGLMSFVSELGYGSLPDLTDNNKRFADSGNPITPAYRYHKRLHEDTIREMKACGLDKMFASPSDFYLKQQEVHGKANRRMIEAVRSNARINGYCVHALTAGDWILGAGLLDLWRNPKKDVFEQTKVANQEQIAIVRVMPRNVFSERGAIIDLTGVSELKAQVINWMLEIKNAQGMRVWTRKGTTELGMGVTKLLEEKVITRNMRGNHTITVVVTDRKGKVLSRTERDFDVFTQRDLATTVGKIAVVDFTHVLVPFLEKAGFTVEKFSIKTDPTTPVLLGKRMPGNTDYLATLDHVNTFVEKGGNAVFLETPSRQYERTGPQKSYAVNGVDYLPSKPVAIASQGLWDGILHMVHDHPVFNGLPKHVPMIGIYENIAPTRSFKRQHGEIMVSAVAFDPFPDKHNLKRNYLGPGEVWWASDLVGVKHGKGTIILSTLNLLPHIHSDPVAQRVLFNLIRYVEQ